MKIAIQRGFILRAPHGAEEKIDVEILKMKRPSGARRLSDVEQTAARHGLRRPPELTAEIAAVRWRELNRLLHSVMVLHSLSEERRPLHRVLRTAGALVGATRGIIYLGPGTDGALSVAAASGFVKGVPERLRDANEMASAALLAGKPVMVGNPADERLERMLGWLGLPHAVSVPVLRQGQPWGILQLLRETRFDEDEAVLLWIYALVVEDALSGLARNPRPPASLESPTSHPALVALPTFQARVDWEIECSLWGNRSCSLIRLGWSPDPPETAGILGQPRSLRILRRSLRPVDLVALTAGGELLIFLPDTDTAAAAQAAGRIRRNFVQSRVLGDETRVLRALRLERATCPDHGRRRDEMLRSLRSEE